MNIITWSAPVSLEMYIAINTGQRSRKVRLLVNDDHVSSAYLVVLRVISLQKVKVFNAQYGLGKALFISKWSTIDPHEYATL